MRTSSALALLVAALLAAYAPAQDEIPPNLGDRAREILVMRCAECHGRDVRKPDGDFGYVEDLGRVVEEYVTPGDVDESLLWLTMTDPESPMPPPEAKAGPLTVDEMAVVRWWIKARAPMPRGPSSAPATEEDESERSRPSVVGRFHPLLVHFPIALLLAAVLAELLVLKYGREGLDPLIRFCLALGVPAAVLASVTGWVGAESGGWSWDTVWDHRLAGILATVAAALSWFLLEMHRRRPTRARLIAYRLALLATAILIVRTGHHGGLLVHGADYFSF